MGTINLSLEHINSLAYNEIVENESVKNKFIQVWDTLWGDGAAAYEREGRFFTTIINGDEKFKKVTKFSIFTSFMDLAVSGLTLQPGAQALSYLQPRSFKIGTDPKGNTIYEGRCVFTISGYGELLKRARDGQIKYADNPVLVYSEDEFSFTDRNGQKQVNYTCHLPHTSNHIIACFIKIVRNDDSVDYSVMLEEDWLRLKTYSEKNNKRWSAKDKAFVGEANTLYSSSANGGIDAGFLKAKAIKHAFKSYPKSRIGRNTVMETEQIEQFDDSIYDVEPPMPTTTFAPEQTGGVTISEETAGNDGTF